MSFRGKNVFQKLSNQKVRLLLFAVLATLTCDLVSFRQLFFHYSFSTGELARGQFETFEQQTVLAYQDTFHREMEPDLDLYKSGELRLPPGQSILLSLSNNDSVKIQVLGSNLAPYTVLGSRRTLPSGVSFDDRAPDAPIASDLSFLDGAHVFQANADGTLHFVPWEPDHPWANDETRLRSLVDACQPVSEQSGMSVVWLDDAVRVQYGRCSGAFPFEKGLGQAQLAVLSGPGTAVVKRSQGWNSELRLNAFSMLPLAFVLSRAITFIFGLSPLISILFSLTLAMASLFYPFESLICLVLSGVVGALATAWRAMKLTLGSPKAPMRKWLAASACVVLIGGGVHAFFGNGTAADSKNENRKWITKPGYSIENSGCIFTGYSTANDWGMDFGSRGTFSYISTEVSQCRNTAHRSARAGEVSRWIKEFVCDSDLPAKPGALIIFLGGTNDDFIWSFHMEPPTNRVRPVLAMLRQHLNGAGFPMRGAPVSLLPWLESTANQVLERWSLQEEEFRQIASCASARGSPFWFFHDFLASDLGPVGPGPARSLMRARRRAITESAGGHFVDLFDSLKGQAGISWFNDFIHLSSIGHREAARLIANLVEGSVPTDGDSGQTSQTEPL